MKLASWGLDLLDLLLPPGCAACKTWQPGGRGAPLVCGRCRSRLRVAPWPRCPRCHFPRGARRVDAPDCLECREWPEALTAARYAYVLEHPADDLVHALKYEGWRELADVMGGALVDLIDSGTVVGVRARDPVVVPVPTTARRLARRGYNQAELLAARLAAGRDCALVHALVRAGEGRSQTALSPTERRENVRGAFAPVRAAEPTVSGADIVLVDDVLTTGATASEAAAALAAMGAASVTLVAFARALPMAPRRPA
ncbi:MAG TPA: phosphoribosyltransferase family protein [Candidatus Limnocylindrales bacterium]|nr:phosphoribosyltransferase family protein [Candidatus Limnocylindrales bacterium]